MILPSLARTGPGIVVQDLCTEFVKLGHKCKVFYFDDTVGLEMPCDTQRIKFRESFDFDNWDIIHSHMFRPDAYVWFHRKKMKRSKTVSTLHNPITYNEIRKTYSIGQSLLGSILWPFLLRSMNHIVTLNSITLSEINSNLINKSSIIINGRNITPILDNRVLLESDNKLKKIKGTYKIIGSICSLTKRKGLDQIIKALTYIPNFALVSLGNGPERDSLIELSKDIGVSDRCYFVGFKDNASDYASIFDIFVLSSKSEGFPLALIEAAAYGVPTVLSDIPILKSIISDDEVSFYHIGNIQDLAGCIKKVYDESEKYSRNIKQYYMDNLTANVMVLRYNQLYNSLINTK